jgi:nucleoside-diphosphate-sugar epimerase
VSRVLVTGGTGFIGRHAVAALVRAGHELHVVARAPADGAGVTWHAADLLDPGVVEEVVAAARATHLLHLAWYAEHGRFWNAPENVLWVERTLALFRAFAAHGGERAVMAGTGAEYDWAHGFCSEGVTPCRPATLYGAAKDATRRVVSAAGQQLGVEVAWGRVFFLYGPHEHPDRLVASVARALVEGRPAPISSGRQVRDFMHAEDVGGAFAALVDHTAVGAINVASGEPVAVRDLAATLGRLAGAPELVRVGELPDRPGEPPLLVADSRRLRHEVGFAPRYSLTDGLGETLDWWRARADGRERGGG